MRLKDETELLNSSLTCANPLEVCWTAAKHVYRLFLDVFECKRIVIELCLLAVKIESLALKHVINSIRNQVL